MKKIVSFLFVSLLSFSLLAQDVFYGVKAGGNVSNTGKSSLYSQAYLNFQAGLFTDIVMAQEARIQMELLYSVQGGSVRGTQGLNVKYDYVVLPVMLKFLVKDAWFAQLGPQAGYLLKAQGVDSFLGSAFNDITDQVQRLDFGLALGGEYNPGQGLNFFARYYYGFTNLNKLPSGSSRVIESKNRVMSVGLGYSF